MKWGKTNYQILVIVILLIMLVLNILSFLRKDSARNLETVKVGGVENMEAVQELYKSDSYIAQQGTAIDQALAQINMAANVEVEPTLDIEAGNTEDVEVDTENANNDMIAELNNIKESAVIHGDENARFTILEYSEFLCPYCKRQSDQGTINSVLEKYPTEVNAMFRNFIVHSTAAKLWEAVECVGELWTNADYFDFIAQAFAYQESLDIDVLWDIANNLWIKEKALNECVDSGRYTDIVNKQSNEGRELFGVTGTPGNVIIDKMTGKFVLIPWAYPPEKFIEEIEKMKAGE